jgi:hypothetical protein
VNASSELGWLEEASELAFVLASFEVVQESAVVEHVAGRCDLEPKEQFQALQASL